MHIVPAGVHDAIVQTFIGHIVGFFYGQRIHIGAQCNDAFMGLTTFYERHNTVAAHALPMFYACIAQLRGNVPAGLHFLKRQFRVLVQVSALLDAVGVVLAGKFQYTFFDIHNCVR